MRHLFSQHDRGSGENPFMDKSRLASSILGERQGWGKRNFQKNPMRQTRKPCYARLPGL